MVSWAIVWSKLAKTRDYPVKGATASLHAGTRSHGRQRAGRGSGYWRVWMRISK